MWSCQVKLSYKGKNHWFKSLVWISINIMAFSLTGTISFGMQLIWMRQSPENVLIPCIFKICHANFSISVIIFVHQKVNLSLLKLRLWPKLAAQSTFFHFFSGILKRVFGKYGEIRQMDIPVLDPYRLVTRWTCNNDIKSIFRPKIDPTIDARKHSNPVLFDVYIQYKSYDGFMLCMDGLR